MFSIMENMRKRGFVGAARDEKRRQTKAIRNSATEAIMTVRKLEKANWRPYFDHLSKTLTGSQAEIEISSLSLGNQTQAGWLPLIGLVYDPKDDIVELALDGLDHLIHKPRDIYVEDAAGLLASLEIIDADGVRQIVKLKEPLLLPRPQ
jgi:hypothetical protein